MTFHRLSDEFPWNFHCLSRWLSIWFLWNLYWLSDDLPLTFHSRSVDFPLTLRWLSDDTLKHTLFFLRAFAAPKSHAAALYAQRIKSNIYVDAALAFRFRAGGGGCVVGSGWWGRTALSVTALRWRGQGGSQGPLTSLGVLGTPTTFKAKDKIAHTDWTGSPSGDGWALIISLDDHMNALSHDHTSIWSYYSHVLICSYDHMITLSNHCITIWSYDRLFIWSYVYMIILWLCNRMIIWL